MGKIMESGLQYAVNACQNAIVNGDQKLLSQMFCDDKESQANAKRIKNQWDELSSTDKQILRKNISKDLRVNLIRYEVKVGADDRCYLLLSAQCFQVWDAAIPNYYKEAREDDDLKMAKEREDTKLYKQLKDMIGKGKKTPGCEAV